MNRPTDFAESLTKFFTSYMPGHRNLSVNTIRSYAETFSLFVTFCEEQKKLPPEKLTLDKITLELVEAFMEWIEKERNNAPSSRRQRLAALRSFFRYMQKRDPAHMLEWQRILSIQLPKSSKPLPSHIRANAMQALLAAPDTDTPQGLRDCALICLLYDTGARVQELIDLSIRDIRLDAPATATLMGKGRKMRAVPLLDETVQILEQYVSENRLNENGTAQHPLFFNRQGGRLTRAGVSYIIRKYIDQNPNVDFPKRISPHTLRHSKAMHLLQSGVNSIYIRDVLGHADLATTKIYAKADTEMKRQVLQEHQREMIPKIVPTWHKDNGLRAWLKSLSTQ